MLPRTAEVNLEDLGTWHEMVVPELTIQLLTTNSMVYVACRAHDRRFGVLKNGFLEHIFFSFLFNRSEWYVLMYNVLMY